MNREIKFRAWDIENKCFYKPTYKAYDGQLHDISITLNGIVMERTLESCASMLNDQNYVLQQFTGLKDKNGVEIYEGDILNCGTKKLKVIFENGCFRTPYIDEKGNLSNYKLSGWIECEVIGNIYQTLELL